MPSLTDREKRTIRIAAVGISIYLALFFGFQLRTVLESRRADYQKLEQKAERIRRELRPYENKILLAEKLKQTMQIEPTELSGASLVAEAGAAIQKAALLGGVQLGPIRESPGRASSRELASMQLEAFGPVQPIITLLHRFTTLGYPIILESVQFTPHGGDPNMIKLSLQLVILDLEQWKKEKPRNV